MDVALLIAGGGPAALAAARGYREAGGAGPVLLVADEHRAPYRRPPLTKDYLRGEMGAISLPIEPPSWYREHAVDVASSRVVQVDHPSCTASLEDGREVVFEHLILATGSAPARLPLPGVDLPQVLVVRTAGDVHALLERLGEARPATVIGSGFIGCEITASLRRRGHPVTLVSDEPLPQAARLGEDVGGRIAGWLAEAGACLEFGAGVTAIEPVGDGSARVLTDEGSFESDVVVVAAGARRRLELAGSLGLDVSEGGFVTDASMRTALGGVLAAGDAARAHHAVAGRTIQTEHWGDALAQGEVAGRVAAGESAEWTDVPGFWSGIGDRTLKYVAWGDGHDDVQVDDRPHGGFAARYWREGRLVGALTHGADGDYDLAGETLARG